MKTTKGNKLIAKFMGAKFHKGTEKFGEYYSCKIGNDEYYFTLGEDEKFHESWDWLMPAVSKCINEFPYIDQHDKLLQDINDGLMDVDIQQTWNAVIGFINKYNEK